MYFYLESEGPWEKIDAAADQYVKVSYIHDLEYSNSKKRKMYAEPLSFKSDIGHIFNSNYNCSMPSKGPKRVIVNGVYYERVVDDVEAGVSSKMTDTRGITYSVYQNAKGVKAYVSSSFFFMIPLDGENVDTEYAELSYSCGRGGYADVMKYDPAKYTVCFDDMARIVFMDRASKEPVVWFIWE